TGIFAFYSNFAMIISVYINAILITYELPQLIERSKNDDFHIYFNEFRKKMFKHILFIFLFLLIGIYPVLDWQDLELFQDAISIYIYLIFGAAILNYSLCYHFYLYVKKKDKTIFFITLKMAVINVILTFILTYLIVLSDRKSTRLNSS